jgi:hypothetical protein
MVASVYKHIVPYLHTDATPSFMQRTFMQPARKYSIKINQNSSWKRMYLSQPPFKTLTTPAHSPPPWPHPRALATKITRSYEGGTTIGDFFQHCEEFRITSDIAFNSVLGRLQKFEGYAQLEQSGRRITN